MKCTNEPTELRVLHCWESREMQADGPCPHWPAGMMTWPELEAHDPAAADACKRECWMGAHIGPSGTCMLPRGHVGPHDFTNDDEIGVSFAAPSGA